MKKVSVKILLCILLFVFAFSFVGCEKRNELFIDGVQYEYDKESKTYYVEEITFWAGINVEILSEIDGILVTEIRGRSQWLELPAIVRNLTIPETIKYVDWDLIRNCHNLVFNEDDDGYYLGTKDNPYFLFVRPKADEVVEQFSYIEPLDTNPEYKDTPVTPQYSPSGPDVVECVINENTVLLIEGAFAGCDKLKSITIPGYVKVVAPYTFAECEILETVVFEEGVEYVGDHAFEGCGRLLNVKFPNSLKGLGDVPFYHCFALERIELPEGIKEVGVLAFHCNNLREIYLSSSVEKALYLYQYCEKLVSIEVDPNNKHLKSVDGILYSNDGTKIFKYPMGKTEACFIIPDGVEIISSGCFEYIYDLKELYIPHSVTTIEKWFAEDYYLEHIYYEGTKEQWKQIKGWDNVDDDCIVTYNAEKP